MQTNQFRREYWWRSLSRVLQSRLLRTFARQETGFANCWLRKQHADLPPLKWSSLKYDFRTEDKINGKEEAYG